MALQRGDIRAECGVVAIARRLDRRRWHRVVRRCRGIDRGRRGKHPDCEPVERDVGRASIPVESHRERARAVRDVVDDDQLVGEQEHVIRKGRVGGRRGQVLELRREFVTEHADEEHRLGRRIGWRAQILRDRAQHRQHRRPQQAFAIAAAVRVMRDAHAQAAGGCLRCERREAVA